MSDMDLRRLRLEAYLSVLDDNQKDDLFELDDKPAEISIFASGDWGSSVLSALNDDMKKYAVSDSVPDAEKMRSACPDMRIAVVLTDAADPGAPALMAAAREAGAHVLGILPSSDGSAHLAGKGISLLITDGTAESAETALRGIIGPVTGAGFVGLEAEDIANLLGDGGYAVCSSGSASGDDACAEAAKRALETPAADHIRKSERVIMNITTVANTTLIDMSNAAEAVEKALPKDAMMLWGHVIDEELGGVRVTIIAGGLENV